MLASPAYAGDGVSALPVTSPPLHNCLLFPLTRSSLPSTLPSPQPFGRTLPMANAHQAVKRPAYAISLLFEFVTSNECRDVRWPPLRLARCVSLNLGVQPSSTTTVSGALAHFFPLAFEPSSSGVAYNGDVQVQDMYSAFKSSTLGRLEDRLDFLVDSPGFSNPAKEELAPVQRQTNHRACGSCTSQVDLRLHRPRAKSVMSYFDQTQDAKELRGWQGRGTGSETRGLGRDLKHFGISCEPQLAQTAETVRAMPARDAVPHRGRELLPMKRVGYTNIRLNTDASLGGSCPGVADTN